MALLNFEIGDKVFCIHHGWGVISQLNGWSEFPIYVKFDNGDEETYDIRGSLIPSHIPTLSFKEYTFKGFSQEKPEELPKPGDIVWVRDREYDNWMITYFRKYSKDKELKYGTNPRNSGDSNDVYFYKFITTKNPYEK